MKKHSILLARLAAIALAMPLGIATPSVFAHGKASDKKESAAAISPDEYDFGRQGDSRRVDRTIAVAMSDGMRFTPAAIKVKQMETVKFIVKNKGKAMHEMVLGTMDGLRKHGDMMKKHPGMEHDEPYMAHVKPGGKEEMVWQFTKAGEFNYGCLVPGHLEAGMLGKITVTKG